MTSLEIAELTGKQHKDVMKAIRNMEPAWVNIAGSNFRLGSYKDLNGLKFQLVEYRDLKGEPSTQPIAQGNHRKIGFLKA
jgi:phage regulator Rha-like protein